MQFHQNAHLKLVVLQQMTRTQSSNKSLGLFCSSATTSYISLPFICDQTKLLFILWSSPETHPNIASLYLPPSVCLAGSLTQSFNYSTKLYWASPKCHTLPSVLKVKRSSAGAALSHPASCFHLLTQERFCKLLQLSADYTLEYQSFIL